jgi:hypothetical protein
LDCKMDWERFSKDPNLWITEEERNPAKWHVTGATDMRQTSWNANKWRPCIATTSTNIWSSRITIMLPQDVID